MPTYRTAHDETLDAMLAAVRGATVAGIIGADPVAWASTTSPRVHAGNRAGYVAGLHRGRLPAVEIYPEREEWTRVADSGGDLVSVWVVRAHVPGPTLDAADRLARLLLHASFTAIRSAQLGGGSYLEHGATEVVGELAASPYGFALEARITVAHSYGRDTHEVHEVVVPPAITITAVNPPATIDVGQVFEILGTGLDQVATVTAYVEPTAFPPGGESGPLGIVSQAPGAIYLDAMTIGNVMAALGVSIPFELSFRVYAFAALQDESDPVAINAPVLDPMADAFIQPFDGGPGQVPVTVSTGPGYNLAALDEGMGFQQAVPFDRGPTLPSSYTFAVWHRHAGMLPTAAGVFAYVPAPAWTQEWYNGALEAVRVSNPGDMPVESPPLAWPAGDLAWRLSVMVRDIDTASLSLYIDGALIASVPIPGPNPPPAGPQIFRVGGWPPGFDATMATGAVWMRALTPAEVAAVFAATSYPT